MDNKALQSISTDFDFLSSGKRTFDIEQQAITECANALGEDFVRACEILHQTKDHPGRIIVTGMGKSGHIGDKIAATLASTGSPAFFLHPGEASHGDLGMVTENDTIIAISNSGNTHEILQILPSLRRLNVKIISITSKPDSELAKQSDVHLDTHASNEACPLGLAPTSSTTVTLLIGDALAIALLEARGFTANEFAFSHPAGSLGKKLLIKVADLMHQGKAIPLVSPNCPMSDVLIEMNGKGLGMTTVCDANGKLLGVFTDGDLRRLVTSQSDWHQAAISEVMHTDCHTVSANTLAVDALNLMQDNNITSLVILNEDQSVDGILHLHDLLREGIA